MYINQIINSSSCWLLAYNPSAFAFEYTNCRYLQPTSSLKNSYLSVTYMMCNIISYRPHAKSKFETETCVEMRLVTWELERQRTNIYNNK